MKQSFSRLSLALALVSGLFWVSALARASTPILTLSLTGSGDQVLVTVTGDANSTVVLYYQNSTNYNLQPQTLGLTGYNGYLSVVVNLSTYGIVPNSSAYVVVNNQASMSVAWPTANSYNYGYNNYNYNSYYNSYPNYNNNYGPLTLSQTTASVTVGQSANITISGGTASYTMYPSTPNLFQAVISGNRLQVVGLTAGSGSINVCSSGGALSGCAALYITVSQQNYYNLYNYNYYNLPLPPTPTFYASALAVNPNSLALNIGAGSLVAITGNGGYYISSNTNSNVATAYISNSTLNVYANATGTDSITVCQANGQCATVLITVISGGSPYPYGYTPAPTSNNWTVCAGEGQYCSFSGFRNVRYGANGAYYYRTLNGGTFCENSLFGDPIFGVVKTCAYGG
jgi:hypothetical protein